MAKGDPPWMQDDLVWATIERQRRWSVDHPESPGGKLIARDAWVYAYMARVGDPARPGGRGVVTESRRSMAAALGMGKRTLDKAIATLLQRGFIQSVGAPEQGETKTYRVVHPRDVATSGDEGGAQNSRRSAPDPAQEGVRDIRAGGARIPQEGVRENGNQMTGLNDRSIRTATPQSPPPLREGGMAPDSEERQSSIGGQGEVDMVEAPNWPWGDLSQRMTTWRSAAGIPQTRAALLARSNGYELDASQWGKYERGVSAGSLDAIRDVMKLEPTPEQAAAHQGDRSAAETAAAIGVKSPEWSAVRNGIEPEHVLAIESVLAIDPATFTVPPDLPGRMKAFRAGQSANGNGAVEQLVEGLGIAAYDWRKAEKGEYVMPDVLDVIEAMLDGRLKPTSETKSMLRKQGPTVTYAHVVKVGVTAEECSELLAAIPGSKLVDVLRAGIAVGQAYNSCGVAEVGCSTGFMQTMWGLEGVPAGQVRVPHNVRIPSGDWGAGTRPSRATRCVLARGIEMLTWGVSQGLLGPDVAPVLTARGELRQRPMVWVGEGERGERPICWVWLDRETGKVRCSTRSGPQTCPSIDVLIQEWGGAVLGHNPWTGETIPDPQHRPAVWGRGVV